MREVPQHDSAPALVGTGAEPYPPRRLEIDIAPAAIVKVLCTLAILWLVFRTWEVTVSVIISLMFVATFNPLVRRLQTRVGRGWAITAVMLTALLGVALLLGLIIPSLVRQGQSLVERAPELLSRAEELARGANIQVDLRTPGQQVASRVAPTLLSASLRFLGGVMTILTIFVLTIYLLIEGPDVGKNLLRLLPRPERQPVQRMVSEIGVQIGAYVRGQLLTSVLAGLFSFAVLSVLGVPEPLALAALMAVADLIPMVGPIVGTVPAVLMALSRDVPTAGIVLAAYLVYQQIEGNLIVPRVYGQALKLTPVVVLIAFLVGGTLMGILGALLALPVAAAIPIIAGYVAEWRERTHPHHEGAAVLGPDGQIPGSS